MSLECNKMVDLSTSIFLKTSLIINLSLAILALPVIIWATWKIWSMKYTKLFHVNFKIVVQLHLIGFFLHCSGRTILHTMDLINYSTKDDPCDMVPNIYRCFILRFMYNGGLWITNTTAVSLIVERWLATKRSVTYEKDSVMFGMFLAVMQFIITAIPLFFLYYNFHLDDVMYYCVTAQATLPYTPQLSAFLGISFQVTARVSFHFLYRQNKVRIADAYNEEIPSIQQLRQSTFHSTLSNRYQLEQNISSIACLKTFANITSVYVVLQNACYITLMYFAKTLHSYQYYAFVEFICAYPAYAIFTAVVMTRKMRQIRKSTEKQLVGHLNTPNQHYFDSFKQQIA